MDKIKVKETINNITNAVNRGFLGKEEQIRLAVCSACAGLHILIEDRPGVGKTTLANALGKALGLDFGRIQFTPDLLPGDITGMTIWDDKKREFIFHRGPVFHQIMLADELNRAAARTQAALLEAMQEGRVTIDGTTYDLPRPFMVVATQNPSHFSGTFSLPESQLDRFGVSFSLGYAEPEWERKIVSEYKSEDPLDRVEKAVEPEVLSELIDHVRQIALGDNVRDYLIKLANKTRTSSYLVTGFTTRGIQHLLSLAQASAAMAGRDFVIPEDIKWAAPPSGRHKLILTPEMKIENRSVDYVIDKILSGIAVPV
jgi:MoxR-like ATPase